MIVSRMINFCKSRKLSRLSVNCLAISGLSVFIFFISPSVRMVYGSEIASVPGITEPVSDVTLSATTGGTVSMIFFREGADVSRGAVILEMDKRIDDLEVERRKLIWDAKAELEAAVARVRMLKWMLDSNTELFNATASVSKEELEKLRLEYELAVAEQKKLEAQEERERIEYEMACDALRKRSIVSPIQGRVVKMFLEEGEGFQENQPLVQVVDTSRVIFTANVEEWVGREFRNGQAVPLKINAGRKNVAVTGKIIFVSPVVDPASGLLEVKVEFNNPDGMIRPGVTGSLLLR